jgi:hypothetical protein
LSKPFFFLKPRCIPCVPLLSVFLDHAATARSPFRKESFALGSGRRVVPDSSTPNCRYRSLFTVPQPHLPHYLLSPATRIFWGFRGDQAQDIVNSGTKTTPVERRCQTFFLAMEFNRLRRLFPLICEQRKNCTSTPRHRIETAAAACGLQRIHNIFLGIRPCSNT